MRRASAGLTTAVTLGLLLAGCSTTSEEPAGEVTASSSSASATRSATAPPTGPPPVSTSASPSGPPAATASAVGTATLPPVAVGEDADFGDGLVARVVGVEPEELSAQGPGEVAGPGVLVTVELTNGSPAPIDLDGLTVTASYGSGEQASPGTTAAAVPPAGRLEPGDDVTGSWAFVVPTDQQASVQLSISSISSPNVITVTR